MRTVARRSLRGAVVPVVAVVVTAGTASFAGTGAVARSTTRAASGTYGAAATAPDGAPSGTYVVIWTSPLTPQPVDLLNSGTLSLASLTFAATNSKPSGTAPPEIAFDACVGGTWNSSNVCSGTTVRIGTTSGGTLSVTTTTVPVAGGSRLALRVVPTSLYNFPQTFTTTVTITVTRANVRAATVTNA